MFMVNKASCESRQLELNQKHRQILESKGDMSPGAKSRYLHALPISWAVNLLTIYLLTGALPSTSLRNYKTLTQLLTKHTAKSSYEKQSVSTSMYCKS